MSDTSFRQDPPLGQDEEAWPESEQRFQAVWEQASDGMALSTADGTVIAANPAYFQLYGYSPEEVIGKNYSIIFPEEQRKWAQEIYDYIFQSPTINPSFETPIRRGDGTERIVESRYNFLTHNGKRIMMLSIVRDITERKQVEEALRESQLKLHLALELGHMGTWDWDIPSDTIYLSANMEAALGFPPGTVSGTYQDFLQLVHSEDRTQVDSAVRRAIEEGDEYSVEFRAIRFDGKIFWLRAQGQVLNDDAGKPLRMIGVVMDISQYKKAE